MRIPSIFLIVSGLLTAHSSAASVWSGGTGSWSSTTSPGWISGGVPNATGASGTKTDSTTTTTTQNIAAGVTVGSIILGGSGSAYWNFTLTNAITFNNGGSGATISNTDTSTGTTQYLGFSAGTMTLADNLLISNTGAGTTASGDIQISSTIGGTGNITFSNVSTALSQAGSIRIQTGVNNFVGSVLVQKGTVTFNNASSFGGVGDALTLGQSSQGSAALLSTTGLTLTNNITVAASTTGTTTLGSISTSTGGVSGTILLNGDLSISAVGTSNAYTLSNTISGTGSLTTIGAGIVTLSKANTFQGIFTASAGTTNLSTANALGGVSAVSVASGATLQSTALNLTDTINDTAPVTVNGTLDLRGGTETIGNLSGNGSVAIGSYTGSTIGGLTVGTATDSTFAGVISGAPVTAGNTVFTKQSTGTLTLSGVNTYTGGTSVNGGTLLVNGSTASGSTVTVGDGAGNNGTLGGTGTVGGATTVNAGSIITGNAIGTIGTLNLTSTLTINGTYVADISGATSDKLAITGAVNATGALVNFVVNQALTASSYVLATYQSITGTFTSSNVPAGYQLDQNGTTLSLDAVPEPSTWLGGFFLLGTVAYSQRRRFAGLAALAKAA